MFIVLLDGFGQAEHFIAQYVKWISKIEKLGT
jgi:hypothetical protein